MICVKLFQDQLQGKAVLRQVGDISMDAAKQRSERDQGASQAVGCWPLAARRPYVAVLQTTKCVFGKRELTRQEAD